MQADIAVKICGLSTAEDLKVCTTAGADFVGLVFFEKSPRHLSFEAAAALADARTEASPQFVALSVDADDGLMADIIASARPDMLQLHGSETPEDADALRQRYGLPVMKVQRVSEPGDIASSLRFTPYVDWLLFDAAAAGPLPGGTGHQFNWHWLAQFESDLPYMLAGGLDPTNVQDAIRLSGTKAVDVSSGVEKNRGKKDATRIQAFVTAAKMR
ncbi:MAG: phosphoribosylanthranilate isomerase [Candidatus Puniceispirillaceae bacterium]